MNIGPLAYPTLEEYQEALQNPRASLLDNELRMGTVATTGLGLPLALCGGFALTYTVRCGPNKYAVRCFHKHSPDLERRYDAISHALRGVSSSYFVNFSYLRSGVRMRGGTYPIVKMAWSSGETLGEFLESQYQNAAALSALRNALVGLDRFLSSANIAHGDLQPGNIMVSDGGKRINLIDYDGMYVSELKALQSAELGHRNFQHLSRTKHHYDERLDRFSLNLLYLALEALEHDPSLWRSTRSDGDAMLFRANDFADPAGSAIFRSLRAMPTLSRAAGDFADICAGEFEEIPNLADFVAGLNIPRKRRAGATRPASVGYIGPYTVLDGTKFSACARHVGDRVELIAKIVAIRRGTTRYGKPYVFINFGDWRDDIVKISIWSEGLAKLSAPPGDDWIGRWVSAVGLMEPPYVGKQGYCHLSISISDQSQLTELTETEAQFRLSSSGRGVAVSPSSVAASNALVRERITAKPPAPRSQSPRGSRNQTPNQRILNKVRATGPSSNAAPPQGNSSRLTPGRSSSYSPSPAGARGSATGCVILLLPILFTAFGLLCLHFGS